MIDNPADFKDDPDLYVFPNLKYVGIELWQGEDEDDDDAEGDDDKEAKSEDNSELHLLNESGPSNSSMQHDKGNESDDEDVDIGGNEPPVSSFPLVYIKKDKGCRSSKTNSSNSSSDSDCGNSVESGCDEANVSSPAMASKFPETLDSGAQLDNKATILHELDGFGLGLG
ncbi:hypothetical protein K2173_026347 [Erythroxylum novogranatense]|uniref:Uncharacterized protein n=1 Tax=Erythroxylum novogranatense TaxID=1862640 RepID=A0AAV8SN21_9ROSI|nr:hypothetical protein K2173_026347 [Erythroxylum novogranatense]